MPFYEYECTDDGQFEKFFKTFSDAAMHTQSSACPVCGRESRRVLSETLPPHLYGDPQGWDRPSPTKRFSTKTVSRKDGNASSVG